MTKHNSPVSAPAKAAQSNSIESREKSDAPKEEFQTEPSLVSAGVLATVTTMKVCFV